jgi:hypothetical protein
MATLDAASLHVFFPPELDDAITFADGSRWYVYQNGQGWTLVSERGNWRTERKGFPATWDMGLFIASVKELNNG